MLASNDSLYASTSGCSGNSSTAACNIVLASVSLPAFKAAAAMAAFGHGLSFSSFLRSSRTVPGKKMAAFCASVAAAFSLLVLKLLIRFSSRIIESCLNVLNFSELDISPIFLCTFVVSKLIEVLNCLVKSTIFASTTYSVLASLSTRLAGLNFRPSSANFSALTKSFASKRLSARRP